MCNPFHAKCHIGPAKRFCLEVSVTQRRLLGTGGQPTVAEHPPNPDAYEGKPEHLELRSLLFLIAVWILLCPPPVDWDKAKGSNVTAQQRDHPDR